MGGGGFTGRHPRGLQRLQCPSSQPRRASGCGRTWSTIVVESVRALASAREASYVCYKVVWWVHSDTHKDDCDLGGHCCCLID